jgi:hypothetical protein
MESVINQRQQHSMTMICDTLVPSHTNEDARLFGIRAAGFDLGSPLAEALEESPPPVSIRWLHFLRWRISSRSK